MPSAKATWEEIADRVARYPEKDRGSVRAWVDHRRFVEEAAPGTLRCDLQRILVAARALTMPLLEAARSGDLEKWATEHAWAKVPSDPWQYLGRFGLFLRFHGAPHDWTVKPKAGAMTRAKREKAKRRERFDIVTEATFSRAVEAAGHPMHRALLYLLWDTGMRPGELLSLRYGDVVSDEDGYLYATMPPEDDAHYAMKTGPRRVVLIEAVPAVKEWLSGHPTKGPEDPLWPGDRGAVMSIHRFHRLLARWAPGHTARDFRHTAATRATLRGANEAEVRLYFGWSRDSTMPSYYARFTEGDANRRRLERAGLVSGSGQGTGEVRPVTCPICNAENVRERVFCYACNASLNPFARAFSFRDSRPQPLTGEEVLALLERAMATSGGSEAIDAARRALRENTEKRSVPIGDEQAMRECEEIEEARRAAVLPVRRTPRAPAAAPA